MNGCCRTAHIWKKNGLHYCARSAGASVSRLPNRRPVELQEGENAVLGAIDIAVVEEETQAESDARVLVLRMVKGLPSDARFPLTRQLRVGRSPELDIFLVDPSVSRNHAVLEPQGDYVFVRDAGSTNGTFVNGERVEVRRLQPGDRVAFGKTEMAVEAENAP